MLFTRAVAQTSPISGGSPTSCINGESGQARYCIRPSSFTIFTITMMGIMILNKVSEMDPDSLKISRTAVTALFIEVFYPA